MLFEVTFELRGVLAMDFDQRGFAKIHDFSMDFDTMRSRLRSLAGEHPSGVIIPIMESDLKNQVLAGMVDELNQCDYLKKVFIALSVKNQASYNEAVAVFSSFKVPHEIIWCNKSKVASVLGELKTKGLDVTSLSGKGRDVWIAMGIASLELHAFVVHDADILNYTRMVPTKMLYPVIEPKLDFFFAKGYYARINLEKRKMYGRITRLFMNPVLEALQEKLQHKSRFVSYLQSFSYPLSGEIAIYSDLAMRLRIPCDWGFEVGLLAELYRNASYERICEVDLGFYDHKHKEVVGNGLVKTAEDSLVTLLRTLTETDGIEVSQPFLQSLQVMYRKMAQDKIRQYNADATCNNLDYDRHQEESSVDSLSEAILTAGKRYLVDPSKAQMPDWLRTKAAMPDIRERLREAAI
jgi:glucosyl-3-phosphoglycerate synthase